MNIISYANFHSACYKDISWKKIFYDVGCALSRDGEPMGLMNHQYCILMTDDFLNQAQITLCGYPMKIPNHKNVFDHLPLPMLSDMIVLRWKSIPNFISHQQISESTLSFVQLMLDQVITGCKKIFHATFEHLSHRAYERIVLSEHPVIQHDFAKVCISFEAVRALEKHNLSDIVFCLSILIDILMKISQLGGARSVLKNRAIDLLCHLKIFQKFILAENSWSQI